MPEISRIKGITANDDLTLSVLFDGGEHVIYDVKDDIDSIEDFKPLMTETGLFRNFQLDSSRTCIYWSERIDLPSDTILEYGKRITTA